MFYTVNLDVTSAYYLIGMLCSSLIASFPSCLQAMVKLIIERYTREAGVRNLERNLAALARAAAVKVAEQVNTLRLGKEIQPITTTLLDSRLADGGEVEMEVIPMGHDISNTYENPSPLIVDEGMLEKVLGVCYYL